MYGNNILVNANLRCPTNIRAIIMYIMENYRLVPCNKLSHV